MAGWLTPFHLARAVSKPLKIQMIPGVIIFYMIVKKLFLHQVFSFFLLQHGISNTTYTHHKTCQTCIITSDVCHCPPREQMVIKSPRLEKEQSHFKLEWKVYQMIPKTRGRRLLPLPPTVCLFPGHFSQLSPGNNQHPEFELIIYLLTYIFTPSFSK